MKTLPLTLLLLCLFNCMLLGQREEEEALEVFSQEDVYNIYLKDGGYECGHIIGDTDSVLIVKQLDETEIHLPFDNLKTIRRRRSEKYFYNKDGYAIKRGGTYHTLAYSASIVHNVKGFNNRGNHYSTSHGIRFKKRFALGVGVSFDNYQGPDSKKFGFIPVYAEFRTSFKDVRNYPYISLACGMGLKYNVDEVFTDNSFEYYNQGLFTKATVGIVHASKGWLDLFLEIGIRSQVTNLFYEDYDIHGQLVFYKGKYTFRRFNVAAGFLF